MANQTGKRSAAEDRLSQVASHLNTAGPQGILQKHPDDIVVTTALRTAICKGFKGQFKDTPAVSPKHCAAIQPPGVLWPIESGNGLHAASLVEVIIHSMASADLLDFYCRVISYMAPSPA